MTTGKPDAVATVVARNLSEFRAAVSDSFVPLRVTSRHPDRFRGLIRGAETDEIHLTTVDASDHTVERTPELIARDDRAYFKVSMMLAGHGLLIQDNREALLAPGDLAVYDTSRPYSLVFDEDFRTIVVMFPRQAISLPPSVVGEMSAVRIDGSVGLGNIVGPFLAQLAANLDQVRGPIGTRLTHTALELVTAVLARELGLDQAPADPHRALAQQIRDYIDRHLASSDLSPATIAGAHYISTRHLHGLFREQGVTVSTWIRARRLEQCRRDLIDPGCAHRPVAAIAARWGFVDAAHFSRTFKAAYRTAPSEYRATH